MDLVISVTLLGLAVVMSVFVYLSVRMPVEPAWAEEWLVANVWCVAITGFLVFGFAFGVKFVVNLDQQTFGLREIGLLCGFSAFYWVLLRLMSPLRRSAMTATLARVSDSGLSEHEITPQGTLLEPGRGEPKTPIPGFQKAA